MSEAETQDVQLSDLKFAGLRPPVPSNPLLEQKPSRIKPDPDPAPGPTSSLAPDTKADSKPYEYLAADKPGEELKPGAGIWKLYLDEAQEHDNELVEGKNKNLDLMLLFAGLFSAVLTAFLIESIKLLQEDTAETSVMLLLAIAQSQQRLEHGSLQDSFPIERPSFLVPTSARWINGLWFTALALSLSAALVGLLAKEWLTAFAASRPRSAYSYALLHQTRINGLARWRALHIIDLLPSMLHLSLLLFSLGLTIYLWTLDVGVAVVISVISGFTLVFYIATAFSGAFNKHCPFITQISKYIHLIWRALSKSCADASNEYTKKGSTGDHLRALIWLSEHARDPVVMGCSYQALAGLQLPSVPGSKPHAHPSANDESATGIAGETPSGDSTTKDKKSRLISLRRSGGAGLEHQQILNTLFDHVCRSLEDAIAHQPQDLLAWRGMNVARYANALPTLVHSLETCRMKSPTKEAINMQRSLSCQTSQSPAVLAFRALDSIWSNECPELSADSYASLTAAELRLTEAVANIYHSVLDESSFTVPMIQGDSQHLSRSKISPNKNELNGENQTVINMQSTSYDFPGAGVPLSELRARYSRALSRAAILLSFHNEERAPISTYLLVHLLEALYQGALCVHLHPESYLSTHQPQSNNLVVLPDFTADIVGAGVTVRLTPSIIGDVDGLVFGLVTVLAWVGVEETPAIELAASRALSAIAPILLRQWSNTNTSGYHQAVNNSILAAWQIPLWSRQTDLPKWSGFYLLQISLFALENAENPQLGSLPEAAVLCLYHRSNAASGSYSAALMLADQWNLVQQLIDTALLSHKKLSQTTLRYLMLLSLVRCGDNILLRKGIIRPAGLPNFLRLMYGISGPALDVQLVLKELEHLLCEGFTWRNNHSPGDLYLDIFLQGNEGFKTLLMIGERNDHASIVADFIACVICIGAEWSPCRSLSSYAIPEYLNAIAFAGNTLALRTNGSEQLVPLMRSAIDLLDASGPQVAVEAANDPSMGKIRDFLKGRLASDSKILLQWEGILSWKDLDAWQYFGMTELFNPTT